MPVRLALKIDVDTERGTRFGVPNLVADLKASGFPATFFFSLGPDNTGRAVTRIFRPGFLRKVSRTNVVGLYGIRTLLNGTLLPAPHIRRRHMTLLRSVPAAGFEIGIHCYDHYRWQDHVHTMGAAAVQAEFNAAREEFLASFGTEASAAAAPGWQANADSRTAYDRAGLLYGSDTRGTTPYFPSIGGKTFTTLEIPTTLPTLDELLGRPEHPERRIVLHLLSLMVPERVNVFTLHAELEGMGKREFFGTLLRALRRANVEVILLSRVARECLTQPASIPICPLQQSPVDGRSGLLAVQGPPVARGVQDGFIATHRPKL
jgi:peptidoglycan/xylan/chitin deacetylase (PgdA/CDA1 family)